MLYDMTMAIDDGFSSFLCLIDILWLICYVQIINYLFKSTSLTYIILVLISLSSYTDIMDQDNTPSWRKRSRTEFQGQTNYTTYNCFYVRCSLLQIKKYNYESHNFTLFKIRKHNYRLYRIILIL